MTKLDFYFDFLSPFSYFAWKRRKTLGPDFTYKPVLMGKLFNHFDFKGPGEIPVKRNSELQKCFRYADFKQIDFTPPSTFPFNPLCIIRLATLHAAAERQEELIELIYTSVWGHGIILEDPELVKVLLEDHGMGEIYERSFEREAKTELKANIKEAIDNKIFGVPTFRYQNENFWGNDSIELLGHALSGNDNWDRKLYDTLREK